MNNGDVDGDSLLGLLGLAVDEGPVQDSLAKLARGMQPELNPDDEDAFIDWVTVNEIGIEYGFEDEAYFLAWDREMRRQGRLILTQLYFYGDTPKTHPFPYPLPFGLTFSDSRAVAQSKLSQFEDTRRSYVRDAWKLPKFDVTIAYGQQTGILQSVLCYIPEAPWPEVPEEAARVATFPPEEFIKLFGLRWSNVDLRARLAPLGYEKALPQVRSEHVADFRYSHGIELAFAPSRKVKTADPGFPEALAFSSITYYSSRQADAREWIGPLPFGLTFSDSQADLAKKVGQKPAQIKDDDFSGSALWNFERYTLTVIYSNIQNHVLRVTLRAIE